jgi:RHS repeat-associated protein
VETYAYDGVGNILSLTHGGGSDIRWKRCYQYAEDSNRLLGTSGAGEFREQPCPSHYAAGTESTLSQRYAYDAHGNMTRMPHLPVMRWDFRDQLQATSRQTVEAGTPETTYYVYDAAGQRVRKVTERQAQEGEIPTRSRERVYLGGVKIYREYNGNGSTVVLERETLHVMDDQRRIAQVDTRTVGDDATPAQSRRFQLGNHLGSSVVDIDEEANVISYEEYHPYGTTAYRSARSEAEASLKRYRYTGKERDEETGLSYHGARYYACWLGRWTAADPIGVGDGNNIYLHVNNNPLVYEDSTGQKGKNTINPGYTGSVTTTGDYKIEPVSDASPANESNVASEANSTDPLSPSEAAQYIHDNPDSEEAFFQSGLYSENDIKMIHRELANLHLQEQSKQAELGIENKWNKRQSYASRGAEPSLESEIVTELVADLYPPIGFAYDTDQAVKAYKEYEKIPNFQNKANFYLSTVAFVPLGGAIKVVGKRVLSIFGVGDDVIEGTSRAMAKSIPDSGSVKSKGSQQKGLGSWTPIPSDERKVYFDTLRSPEGTPGKAGTAVHDFLGANPSGADFFKNSPLTSPYGPNLNELKTILVSNENVPLRVGQVLTQARRQSWKYSTDMQKKTGLVPIRTFTLKLMAQGVQKTF